MSQRRRWHICKSSETDLLRAVPGIVDRMKGILAEMITAPHIAIVGILPRGATFWAPDQTWAWPNRYTQAIEYVNLGYAVRHSLHASHLQAHCCAVPCSAPVSTGIWVANLASHVQAIAATNATRFTYVSCGKPFANSTSVSQDLISEGLHPTAAGNQVLIDCLMPVVRRHVRISSA